MHDFPTLSKSINGNWHLMSSLRSHEGYLLIDHRNSPGVPDEIMVAQGFSPGAGRQDSVFESATFTCSHCEVVVVMNPNRQRERGYCRKCDHYVCDTCEARRVASGGECKPFKVMVEEVLNLAAKKPASSEVFQSPLLLP
jgi:hypothetical protein